MGKYSVECLGDNCPICERNSQIKLENPKGYNSDPNYAYRQRRHYFNVLDRSPIKICTKCEHVNYAYNGKFTTACEECGEILPNDFSKSETVKVMNLSEPVTTDLVNIENTILDDKLEPIGWTNYDIVMIVSKGADGKKKITPQAFTQNNDVVTVNEEDLYDLDEALLRLSRSEIFHLLQGVSLSDIFKARFAAEHTEEVVVGADKDVEGIDEPPFDEDEEDELQQKLENLFEN